MPEELLIDIKNVSRFYGRVQALADVTLALAPGVIGLVGNNGAGKSTLLKILLGLLPPSSGEGRILGCDLLHAGQKLRGKVGYMPETAATVPMLKGVEFVTLAGDLCGMPHRDARRRAHEVLYYVGLGELRYRRLEEYSTGNQQRLKLAAALVHDPQLLLLDEPTNGLDPDGRLAMLNMLADLVRETGKSLILCTHLLTDIERLCEQVVVLHKGRAVCAGLIGDLRQKAGDRYELSWRGDGAAFRHAMVTAGLDVPIEANGAGKLLVPTPPGWRTRRFFELAQQSGVVITELRVQEEDLEQLFFRLTKAGDAASAH
jgi:ABC-2 type transport system ATP-binding protein